MNAKTEAVVIERAAEVMSTPAVMSPTPMTMLDTAVKQGVSIETLDKLMALQERWEANEARKAFSAAMADFRAENITVQKNKTAKFKTDKGVTQYDYATLDVVCEAIVGSLSKHGLSHHWETTQSGDQVTVTCHVTHRMGHRESTSLTSGLDQTGSKNKIQALGSAVRYLERYTLLAATGLAVKDKEDDDGHDTEGTTTAPALSEQEKAAKEKLDACGSIGSLTETWGKLDKDTRRKLNDVFGECKRKIEAADREAARQ